MFPPVEEAILQSNPDFAALYSTLTTVVVLNPNCSTKNDPARKDREAVKEELKKHRIKATKRQLLISALSTANPSETPITKPALRRPQAAPQPPPSSTSTLPPDLLSLLLLLPPFLSTPSHTLSPESTALLLANPPFTHLPSLLPQLTPALSSSLVSQAASLARLLNPTTNPSFIHRTIPSLPTATTTLASTLPSQLQSLSTARAETATLLSNLQRLHAQALEQLIRALESKHGNVARGLELRAAEVAASAARQEVDARLLVATVRGEVYTSRAAAALRNYAAHLRDGRARLGEEIRGLQRALAGYGVGEGGDEGKERTMREMARVYRDMGRQIEEVRGDLERLDKA